MRRFALLAGGLALAVVSVVSGISTVSAAPQHTTKSYLMDFQGTVASPAAGSVYAGEALNQMATGAWQIKFVPQWGGLCLVSAPSWCVANNSGVPKMRQVSVPIHKNWVWQERVQSTGGIRFKSAMGGYLCALGGSGSADIVAATLSACPHGADYDKWFFNGTAAKSVAHTTALVTNRAPVGTANVSNSSCHNEWVEASTNLAGTDPWTQWVLGNGTTINGCGWQQRCHVRFGIPRIGDDDGWVNGGWVRSSAIVSGCKSPDGDGWFIFDIQYRSANKVVHTVRISPASLSG